jgi:Zn-dependent peptidase ImmA (M78 family)
MCYPSVVCVGPVKNGIRSPEDIRLRDIAFNEKVLVVEEPVARAAAILVRSGDRATIRISPADTPERKRFSIAHELGHFKLNHMAGALYKACTQKDMMSWYKSDVETEANFFASELILPKRLVEKKCDVAEVDFKPVMKIANEFSVSLTAAAIRFVRLTPEPCAVVYSENGIITWSYRNAEWWPFIQNGQPLDNRTGAYDFFQGEALDDDPIDVDADAWVSNSRGISEIVENSIGSRQYDFVLSLLWIKPE